MSIDLYVGIRHLPLLVKAACVHSTNLLDVVTRLEHLGRLSWNVPKHSDVTHWERRATVVGLVSKIWPTLPLLSIAESELKTRE